MLQFIILLLIIFWLFGFMGIPFFSYMLISPFTLQNVVLLILMGLVTNLLPGKYRKIGIAIIVIWVISLFGVISVPASSNLFILGFILLSVFSIF